jgi:hypothetical protein
VRESYPNSPYRAVFVYSRWKLVDDGDYVLVYAMPGAAVLYSVHKTFPSLGPVLFIPDPDFFSIPDPGKKRKGIKIS